MRRNQVMKSQGLALRSAGEGPLLLLLHGLGSSSLDWQAQIERFSEHYRVVALDLRGHGQSMQEGPFDVPTLAGDVTRWLDEQPEPAWVVGLSLGAMVALELALQLPHKVRGLVLVNGFSECLLETPKDQERHAMRLKWLRWFGMRPLAWWLARELFPGPELAQVRSTFRQRFVRSNKKKTYRALLDGLPGWSARARLGQIVQPVAIISTTQDYLPLAKRVEQFAALPNASIHTPPGHHAWPAEDPAGFNHLLERILRTH
ncbi:MULTISPECIES: alpha/beta fold hydrolase [Aeromonas]|uniref:alpha/beta fold hydrolase n=1 Tax=Aeromonas TaxID=642 RepID=UPI001F4B4933|nr:alpha/beta hydrolase [Aeromonas aquatica]MCH7370624.1 alpha/beta hydrolase [Aeromonas sp. MR16]